MEFVQHLPNFAQLVAVSSVAASSELQCPTLPLYVYISNTAAAHTAVLVCCEACGADKLYVNTLDCVLDICCYYRDGFQGQE